MSKTIHQLELPKAAFREITHACFVFVDSRVNDDQFVIDHLPESAQAGRM